MRSSTKLGKWRSDSFRGEQTQIWAGVFVGRVGGLARDAKTDTNNKEFHWTSLVLFPVSQAGCLARPMKIPA